jgi:signal transduction histidine kinase
MLMLGVELISSEAVALSELVKNSYDADASTVVVSLTEATLERAASLTVLDDGLGMSPDTVVQVWLEPATPSRRRRKISPAGRRSLGEKGIGRFATAKLANRLELITYDGHASDGEVHLKVDWDDFADEDAYLDEIDIPWTAGPAKFFRRRGRAASMWRSYLANYDERSRTASRSLMPSPTRGTALVMEGLRADWDESLVRDISRTLARLISPAADEALQESERDFQILLDLPPRLASFSGWVGPSEELGRPHYRLQATVDRVGRARIDMRMRDEGESRPPIKTRFSGVGGRSPSCGPFSLSLRVWDRDRDALAEIAPDISYQETRELLDQVAGVSVYRDGFRVLPYGEYGDDWLHLDRRRINLPTRRLSNNQVIGALNITADGNPDLIDQTNREGLVDGPALEDLRHLVREIFTQLETARWEIRHQERAKPRARISDLFQPFRLTELREAVTTRADPELIEMVTDAEERLEERNSEVREVVARYQRLATLGQLIDQIVHEVAQPIVGARQAAVAGLEIIEDWKTDAFGRPINFEGFIDEIKEQYGIVRDQTRAVSEILRRIAPFGGRRRGRPHVITVEDAMKEVCLLLRQEIRNRHVDVSIPDTKTYVTVDGTELQEILLNLLNNSLYWVTRVPRGRPRRVAFEIERESDNALSIYVSDNGPGVPEHDRPRIFEPYFTTREGGVGLGLSLAGEIVEDYYGGSLELISPGSLGGATFRATLRRRVGP